jgi:hypothetical protein
MFSMGASAIFASDVAAVRLAASGLWVATVIDERFGRLTTTRHGTLGTMSLDGGCS